MSSMANSAPCRDTAPRVGATVAESSMRIRTASPASRVTAPSGPGSKSGGAVALLHFDRARTPTNAEPASMMRLRMRTAPFSVIGASSEGLSTGTDGSHPYLRQCPAGGLRVAHGAR